MISTFGFLLCLTLFVSNPNVVESKSSPKLTPTTTQDDVDGIDFVCGREAGGPFSVATAHRFDSMARSFLNELQLVCPNSTIAKITNTRDDATAISSICQDRVGGTSLSFVGRPFMDDEAESMDGILYQCKQENAITDRIVVQVPVAVDAVVLAAASRHALAYICTSNLPGGGLTMNQLRWILSNYTVPQLKATGWSTIALPNSDSSDSTHYWSELCPVGTSCSEYCSKEPINLVGPEADSDLMMFLKAKVLTDMVNGEGIDTTRFSTASGSKVQLDASSLGIMAFSDFDKNLTVPISLQGADSSSFTPSQTTLQSHLYPLAFNVYMHVTSNNEMLVDEILSVSKVMLARPGGDSIVLTDDLVPFNRVPCGQPGAIAGTADATIYSLSAALVNVHSTFCSSTAITITKGDNSVAAQQICRGGKDLALMTRTLYASEANVTANGYTYKCRTTPSTPSIIKYVNEITVATRGVVGKYNEDPGGIASLCIDSLGGLTVDQFRWIFSNFSTSELIATGWDPNSLPMSDNDDGTHLWSELGGSGCPPTEMRIAGFPTTSTAFAVFSEVVFKGETETFDFSRPNGYYTGVGACREACKQGNPVSVAEYTQKYSDTISLADLTSDMLNISENTTTAVIPIKGTESEPLIYPTLATLSNCAYPLCKRFYLYFDIKPLSLRKTKEWLKSIFTPQGDDIIQNKSWIPVSGYQKTYYRTHQLG